MDELGGRVIYASSPICVERSFCTEESFALLGSSSSALSTNFLSMCWMWLFPSSSSCQSDEGPANSNKRGPQDGRRASRTPDSAAAHSGAVVRGVRYMYDTCVAVDCPQWLDAMAACTKAKFPDANISVTHSSSSLSGFCVVLRLPPPITDGYEFITWGEDSELSGDERTSITDESGSDARGLLSSIHTLNRWQWRCQKRFGLAARRCTAFLFRFPLSIYLNMCRNKGHMAGLVVLYAILHGTYFLLKRMQNPQGDYSAAHQASAADGEL